MKKQDIVVGTEYAAGANYQYENGIATRVRVTGFGTVTTGYGYRARKVTGPLVEIFDHKTGKVRSTGAMQSREIREEWAAYNDRWTEIRASRRRSANAQLAKQIERAGLLPQIIGLFEAAGIESERGYVYNAAQKTRLLMVIPERFERDDMGDTTSNFTGPLARDYDNFVTDGKGFTLSYDDILKIASIDR